MRIHPSQKLFLGVKIDSKLREALGQATPGDRKYFDDPTSEFLRVLPMAEAQYVGKLFSPGVAPQELDDISRNVVSILNRVAPNARCSPSSLKLFAVEDNLPERIG